MSVKISKPSDNRDKQSKIRKREREREFCFQLVGTFYFINIICKTPVSSYRAYYHAHFCGGRGGGDIGSFCSQEMLSGFGNMKKDRSKEH